jgi:general secretion pathway protein G
MRLAARLIYWMLFVLIVPVGWLMLLTSLFGDDFSFRGEARWVAARAQIRNLAVALGHYKRDTGRFPDEKTGLKALREDPGDAGWNGPYLQMDVPNDPWGRPYIYRILADGTPEVRSLGSDRKPGGVGVDADISSSKLDAPLPRRHVPHWRFGWLVAGAFGGIVYPLLPRLWCRLR